MRFENAKVITHGRQHGMTKTLNSLKALVSHAKKKVNDPIPSQQRLKNLLEQYNAGRFADAEKSPYRSLSNILPTDFLGFAWIFVSTDWQNE